MYVSMPKQTQNENDNIYQSIEYEVPTGRHQYASIDDDYLNSSTLGQSNRGKCQKQSLAKYFENIKSLKK